MTEPRVYVCLDDDQELDKNEVEDFFRHFDDAGRLARRTVLPSEPGDLVGTLDGYDVMLVLVGRTTAARRVVDWELREALSPRADGGPALGVLACTVDRNAELSRTPARLGANVESGYARLYRRPLSAEELWTWVGRAAETRYSGAGLIRNDAKALPADLPITDTWTW